MYYFCTYFDRNYLPRARALHHSLEQRCSEFRLYSLCMDQHSLQTLRKAHLPHLVPIPLEDFERDDDALVRAKPTRTRVEYCFTCSPSLPLYILNQHPEVDIITYVDADLYFFADPQPIFDELEGHSIGIVGHRLPPRLKWLEKNGIYNVGWVSFRRDENGLACLEWWRERCIEWCYERYEDGKWSDQGYLNDWPQRFHRVCVIQHKGANLAPWNVANYTIDYREGDVWVDEQPLLFFHFHGLKQVFPWLYDTPLGRFGARLGPTLRKRVFEPYINDLRRYTTNGSTTKMVRSPAHRFSLPGRVARKLMRTGSSILSRSYIVVINGRVF